MSQPFVNWSHTGSWDLSFSGAPATVPGLKMPDRLAQVIDVKDWGATGDGITDDTSALQNAFAHAYPGTSASTPWNNRPIVFRPGYYKISSPLTFSATGAMIFGAGPQTTIENTTSNSTVLKANGLRHARIQNLRLVCSGTSPIGIDLDWDGSGGGTLQQNFIAHMVFDISGVGVRVSHAGGQEGNDNLFYDCTFNGCNKGFSVEGAQATMQTIYGGSFKNCARAISLTLGSIPVIRGVVFQGSTGCDIETLGGNTHEAMAIHGCRTDSANFVKINSSVPQVASIKGCSQSSSSSGYFALLPIASTISGCVSRNGQVDMPSGGVVEHSQFHRNDWLFGHAFPVWIENVFSGGTLWGDGAGGGTTLTTPNLIEGFMHAESEINNAVFFIGKKSPLLLFSQLPPPATAWKGYSALISDSTTTTQGAAITGGGANTVLAFCNGSAWSVAGG